MKTIAASIDALGVNGAGIAREHDAIGFRVIPLLPDYGRFDGKILMGHVTRLGPYSRTGSGDATSRIEFAIPQTTEALRRVMRREIYNENTIPVPTFAPGEAATLIVEWRFDSRSGILSARISADAAIDAMLLLNGCVAPATVTAADAASATLAQGGLSVSFAWSGDIRSAVRPDTDISRLESALRGYHGVPHPTPSAICGVRVAISPGHPLFVSAADGGTAPSIDVGAWKNVAQDADGTSCGSSGAAADCDDAIRRLVGFSSAYDTRICRRFLPVNRDWAGPNSLPPVFMWDNFFDSYLACFTDPALAKESLGHILGVIKRDGIPNAPPQRNLVIPVIFSKLVRFIGDDSFTRDSFPAMMDFMRFWFADRGDGHPWRDGNDDGLIESGSCLRAADGVPPEYIVSSAFDETGYDDSPMYSAGFAYQRRAMPADGIRYDFDRGTLNLTLVGQNSLYVAACRAMAVVADDLGLDGDASWLRAEAERVATRIRERLYCKEYGIFQNRFFDGTFSPVLTPDIFSPLTAGIADPATAERLHSILRDPGKFWGENLVPTVSFDDPAFGDEPFRDGYWKGNYWRGNIWPPTNYIAYLALRATDWRETRREFARRSRRLFMDDWLPHHHANENYPPFGATHETHMFAGNGGRDPHYIWSGILPAIALEELFSVEDTARGIRFGAAAPEAFGSWEGFTYHGGRGSIKADADGVRLELAGLTVETDAPCEFREFEIRDGRPHGRYFAPNGANVKVAWNGGSAVFKVPASAPRRGGGNTGGGVAKRNHRDGDKTH